MKDLLSTLTVLGVLSSSVTAHQPAARAQATAATSPAPGSTAQAVSQPQAIPNTLLDGTAVKLRLEENLSSETNKTGDQVPFEATEEVDVEGVPVILKGAQALATVTNAEPKRRMGRGGKLDVNIDSIRLADGEKAQLRAVKDSKAGGHVGAMTGAIVATSIVFFPAAPLFLLMHGKPVEIPKGTEITAFTQGDMHLDLAKFRSNGSPTPAEPSASAMKAELSIDSTPIGADIEIDGAFVGSTPSTVAVLEGQHTITLKRKGYTDWNRTMNVAGSAVHLHADLDARQ